MNELQVVLLSTAALLLQQSVRFVVTPKSSSSLATHRSHLHDGEQLHNRHQTALEGRGKEFTFFECVSKCIKATVGQAYCESRPTSTSCLAGADDERARNLFHRHHHERGSRAATAPQPPRNSAFSKFARRREHSQSSLARRSLNNTCRLGLAHRLRSRRSAASLLAASTRLI